VNNYTLFLVYLTNQKNCTGLIIPLSATSANGTVFRINLTNNFSHKVTMNSEFCSNSTQLQTAILVYSQGVVLFEQ